jgi:hypothetical protein
MSADGWAMPVFAPLPNEWWRVAEANLGHLEPDEVLEAKLTDDEHEG